VGKSVAGRALQRLYCHGVAQQGVRSVGAAAKGTKSGEIRRFHRASECCLMPVQQVGDCPDFRVSPTGTPKMGLSPSWQRLLERAKTRKQVGSQADRRRWNGMVLENFPRDFVHSRFRGPSGARMVTCRPFSLLEGVGWDKRRRSPTMRFPEYLVGLHSVCPTLL
jgi:hypothetical protein